MYWADVRILVHGRETETQVSTQASQGSCAFWFMTELTLALPQDASC